ncbi:hypothetical protein FBQ82_02210 [Anaerolineae bacterium CFX7]|nr:hypothetical protein [Anaerolineae bacterium CFX7]
MKSFTTKQRFTALMFVASGLPFAGINFFQLAGITFPKIDRLTFIPYAAFRNEMRGDLDALKWKPFEEKFNEGWMHIWSIIPHEYSKAVRCWNQLARNAYCESSVVLHNNIACCQFQLERYPDARDTIALARQYMPRADRLEPRDASKIKDAINDNYLYIIEKTKP